MSEANCITISCNLAKLWANTNWALVVLVRRCSVQHSNVGEKSQKLYVVYTLFCLFRGRSTNAQEAAEGLVWPGSNSDLKVLALTHQGAER